MPSFLDHWIARARRTARRIRGYPFVGNVNAADPELVRRRCLLLYLSLPFTRPPDHPSFLTHQNLGQAKSMARALGEAGYVVDVADVHTPRVPQASVPYDLVVTHHPSLSPIGHVVGPSTTVVYLASGMQHAEHNRLVRQRRESLEQRRQCRMPPFAVNDETMSVLPRASVIAGFGNHVTMGTWALSFEGPRLPFDNYGFEWIRPAGGALPDRACHFLFFGSVDQVRKGLDLLLEVFPKHPGLYLHVAGHYAREPAFCACYDRELHRTPNIHLHGVIGIGTPDWDALIRQCAFAILPTCSEGQAGSVVQAMHAGLVPVVTPAAGIDVESFGILLPENPLPSLDETLERVAALPPSELARLRDATLTAAHSVYSETAFLNRWRKIVRAIESVSAAKPCP